MPPRSTCAPAVPSVDEIRLGELGIHGNGHAMMLEQNNAEVAAVITDWIVKHT